MHQDGTTTSQHRWQGGCTGTLPIAARAARRCADRECSKFIGNFGEPASEPAKFRCANGRWVVCNSGTVIVTRFCMKIFVFAQHLCCLLSTHTTSRMQMLELQISFLNVPKVVIEVPYWFNLSICAKSAIFISYRLGPHTFCVLANVDFRRFDAKVKVTL